MQLLLRLLVLLQVIAHASGLTAKLRPSKRPVLLNGRASSRVNCSVSVETDLSECKTCSNKDRSSFFIIQLHPEWAPLGVDRFLELVDLGFFHELRFFKVTDSLVQFGTDYKGRWCFQHICDVEFGDDTPTQTKLYFLRRSIPLLLGILFCIASCLLQTLLWSQIECERIQVG